MRRTRESLVRQHPRRRGRAIDPHDRRVRASRRGLPRAHRREGRRGARRGGQRARRPGRARHHAPRLDGLEVCKRIGPSAASRSSCCRRVGRSSTRSSGSSWAPTTTSPSRSPRELVSRVKANLRRARLEPDRTAPLRAGDLEIDATARTVRRGDEEIAHLLRVRDPPQAGRLAAPRVHARGADEPPVEGQLLRRPAQRRRARAPPAAEGRGGAVRAVLIRTVRGVGYAFGGEDGRAP